METASNFKEFLEKNYTDIIKLCSFGTKLKGDRLLDLTHDFIIYLDKIDFLSKYNSSKSNISTYLLLRLKGFISNYKRLSRNNIDVMELKNYHKLYKDIYDLLDYSTLTVEDRNLITYISEGRNISNCALMLNCTRTCVSKRLKKLSKNRNVRKALL